MVGSHGEHCTVTHSAAYVIVFLTHVLLEQYNRWGSTCTCYSQSSTLDTKMKSLTQQQMNTFKPYHDAHGSSFSSVSRPASSRGCNINSDPSLVNNSTSNNGCRAFILANNGGRHTHSINFGNSVFGSRSSGP